MAGLALLGGLAFAGYRFYLNEVEDSAIELVPPDAVFYGNVYLDPSTRQKQALRELLRHFPSTDTEEEVEPLLDEVFDAALGDVGLDFEDDVKPWLGRQVALFVRLDQEGNPGGAALIATQDAEAALRAARKAAVDMGESLKARTYKGTEYEEAPTGSSVGIVGDFLVAASTSRDLEASVDAFHGRSLEETKDFAHASESLPSDRVALAYLDIDPFLDLAQNTSFLSAVSRDELERSFVSPSAAVAYLRDDAIVFEASAPKAGPYPGRILEDLPATAWVAAGVDDFGAYVEDVLEIFGPLGTAFVDAELQKATGLDLQDDLLAWMGGLGFYLAPPMTEPRVGVVLESLDETKSDKALDRLRILLITEGARLRPLRVDGREGFKFRFPGEARPVLVLGGDRVIVGNTKDSVAGAASVGKTLAEDAQYAEAVRALGAGLQAGLFVRVGPVLNAIAAETGIDVSPTFRDLAPDLEAFSFIIYGARVEDERLTARAVIGVE